VIDGTLIDATKAKELTDNRGTDCCRWGLTVLSDSNERMRRRAGAVRMKRARDRS